MKKYDTGAVIEAARTVVPNPEALYYWLHHSPSNEQRVAGLMG